MLNTLLLSSTQEQHVAIITPFKGVRCLFPLLYHFCLATAFPEMSMERLNNTAIHQHFHFISIRNQ